MHYPGMPTPDTNIDPRRAARALYWQGLRIARIAEQLGEKPATVHSWKRRDKWDESDTTERIVSTIEARLQLLIAKENKEGKDYKEILFPAPAGMNRGEICT